MSTKTWAGNAQNNDASNPDAWSPTGVPAAGDVLKMPSDSSTDNLMNVGTAGLPGTLVIGSSTTAAPATINLTASHANFQAEVPNSVIQTLTVNAQQDGDTVTLKNDFPSSMNATVAIAQGDTLTGNFNVFDSTLTISGGAGTTLVNNGTAFVTGSNASVNADVIGTGTFVAGSASANSGSIEFLHGVASGETVQIRGDEGHDATSKLVVDDLPDFHAPVNVQGPSEVDLTDLAADSYTYDPNSGELDLYSGGQKTGSINLQIQTQPADKQLGTMLRVAHTSSGVAIDYTPFEPSGYEVLPVYVPPSTGSGGGAGNTSGSSGGSGSAQSGSGGSSNPSPPPPDNTGSSSNSGGSSNAGGPSTGGSSSQPPSATPPVGNGGSGGTEATGGTSTSGAPTPPPPTTPSPPPSGNGGTSASNPTPPTNTVPVPPNNGTTPTPLSSAEASALAGLNSAQTHAMTFYDDGAHLGTDYDNLGAAIQAGQDQTPFVRQTVTDLKELLTAYVGALPDLASGVTGPSGATLAIPPQFVNDVINAGLKADLAGSGPLDQAYGGALDKFFASTQQVMLTVPH